MPYVLEDLVVDRVDLVDEGANSAAFIEIFKRKETTMDFSEIISKMKPEHASVVNKHFEDLSRELSETKEELRKANETIATQGDSLKKASEDLEKANETIATQNSALEVLKASANTCSCDGEANSDDVCKVCGKPKKKKSVGFDETEVLKSMPENAREAFLKMRQQKETAEELVRKANEEKLESEAVAKAAALKALPVDQATLVSVLKNCDQNVYDILTSVANALDSVVLEEVGKSGKSAVTGDAWERIEAKAAEVAKRDSITKQKAIGVVIKENPDLYREYLNGGAN